MIWWLLYFCQLQHQFMALLSEYIYIYMLHNYLHTYIHIPVVSNFQCSIYIYPLINYFLFFVFVKSNLHRSHIYISLRWGLRNKYKTSIHDWYFSYNQKHTNKNDCGFYSPLSFLYESMYTIRFMVALNKLQSFDLSKTMDRSLYICISLHQNCP